MTSVCFFHQRSFNHSPCSLNLTSNSDVFRLTQKTAGWCLFSVGRAYNIMLSSLQGTFVALQLNSPIKICLLAKRSKIPPCPHHGAVDRVTLHLKIGGPGQSANPAPAPLAASAVSSPSWSGAELRPLEDFVRF